MRCTTYVQRMESRDVSHRPIQSTRSDTFAAERATARKSLGSVIRFEMMKSCRHCRQARHRGDRGSCGGCGKIEPARTAVLASRRARQLGDFSATFEAATRGLLEMSDEEVPLSSPYFDRLVMVCSFCHHPRIWHTSWHGCSDCGCRKTAEDAKALGRREERKPLRQFLEAA